MSGGCAQTVEREQCSREQGIISQGRSWCIEQNVSSKLCWDFFVSKMYRIKMSCWYMITHIIVDLMDWIRMIGNYISVLFRLDEIRRSLVVATIIWTIASVVWESWKYYIKMWNVIRVLFPIFFPIWIIRISTHHCNSRNQSMDTSSRSCTSMGGIPTHLYSNQHWSNKRQGFLKILWKFYTWRVAFKSF